MTKHALKLLWAVAVFMHMPLPHLQGHLIAAEKSSSSGAGSADGWELGLKGFFNLSNSSNTVSYVDTKMGYFFFNNVELGMSALLGTSPSGQRNTYGLFSEYRFPNSTRFTPYAGGGIKLADPPRGTDLKNARILSIYGGVDLFLSPGVALTLVTEVAYATQNIYSSGTLGAGAGRTRSAKTLDLGLRFFF